jgi:hypothetical protein
MVLHICKPETIQVIEEIARRTGQSAERVVETAVYDYRRRLRTPEEEEKRRQRLQALVDSLAARLEASGHPLVDHGDLLDDEKGLPREGEVSEVELRFSFPERYTSLKGADDEQG